VTGSDDVVLDAIRTRRVVRTMTGEPVESSHLEAVLAAIRAAPNAGNRRLQPTVAVTDARVLRLVRMVSPGMVARPTAAVVICVDVARAVEYGFAPDTPGLFIDVGTAAATGLLAAHALHLAAEPVTSFSRVAVRRLLALRAGLDPRLIICLGHAAPTQPPAMGAWARRLPAVAPAAPLD
jgi:nitroreductase